MSERTSGLGLDPDLSFMQPDQKPGLRFLNVSDMEDGERILVARSWEDMYGWE